MGRAAPQLVVRGQQTRRISPGSSVSTIHLSTFPSTAYMRRGQQPLPAFNRPLGMPHPSPAPDPPPWPRCDHVRPADSVGCRGIRVVDQLTAENEALRQQLQLPTANVVPLRADGMSEPDPTDAGAETDTRGLLHSSGRGRSDFGITLGHPNPRMGQRCHRVPGQNGIALGGHRT